jgi:hypothetical protein
MAPVQRGPHRRLARQIRTASLRATPTEHQELRRLQRLLAAEVVNVFEAQEMLRGLIRSQHDRHDQRAA